MEVKIKAIKMEVKINAIKMEVKIKAIDGCENGVEDR